MQNGQYGTDKCNYKRHNGGINQSKKRLITKYDIQMADPRTKIQNCKIYSLETKKRSSTFFSSLSLILAFKLKMNIASKILRKILRLQTTGYKSLLQHLKESGCRFQRPFAKTPPTCNNTVEDSLKQLSLYIIIY